MKIADGLEMLVLPGIQGSGEIHPAVIWDNKNVILADTGFPGQIACIKEGMRSAGVPFEGLTQIIVTHSDMDHIGNLRAIVDASAGKAGVLAHAAEKPYIEADLQPIRLAQMEANLKLLPAERRRQLSGLYETLLATYQNFRAQVTRTIADGEVLPFCGGIQVIHTPGHTPGHICLYVKQLKVLIAGDAMNAANGTLVPAPDFTTPDKKTALQSLKKLAGLDIETVICYHGGAAHNAAGRIAELAGRS